MSSLRPYVGPDGRVALTFPSGETKRVWPVDAREMMAAGAVLAEKPQPAKPAQPAAPARHVEAEEE